MKTTTKLITMLSLVCALLLSVVSPASAQILLYDFGGTAGHDGAITVSPASDGNYWNNVYDNNGSTLSFSGTGVNGVTTTNAATTVQISTPTGSLFGGANPNGSTTGVLFPVTATQDNLTSASNGSVTFVISGLSNLATYNFTFEASRLGTGSNRDSDYTLTDGVTTGTVDNVGVGSLANGAVASINGVSTTTGSLTFTMKPDATNTSGFSYLGVMEINTIPASAPEPSTWAMLAGGVGALLLLQRRRMARV